MASATPVGIGLGSGPGPYQPGQFISFSITDDNPSGMCDAVAGFCAGDFTVGFDPTRLRFDSFSAGASLPASAFVLAGSATLGGAFGAYLDVSVIPGDLADTPTSPTTLFSITFEALTAGLPATVHVDPTDFGTGTPTYAFASAQAPVQISAVPEPSTTALVFAGLAMVGAAARHRKRSAT